MRLLFLITVLSLNISCVENAKVNVADFKNGSYKTVLEDGETISLALRKDSIQIESYNNVKDTFSIQWLDQFEYVLLKKNPKTLLDSTPFHVKITSIKKNSYTFRAYYKGSNFKQKGTAFKLEDPIILN
jgi:hypothetical protein